jgi:hypothetical protein
LSVRSDAAPESAICITLRRGLTWLMSGFLASSGKVSMLSTAFLISERARSTG